MGYESYTTARRQGTRAGVAPGSVRLCVTIKEDVFLALRERAVASTHTLSGEAADILTRELISAGEDTHGL
jgi:hypothetical protein